MMYVMYGQAPPLHRLRQQAIPTLLVLSLTLSSARSKFLLSLSHLACLHVFAVET